mgnify:FL=1
MDSKAIGLIETIGFTAAVEAVDTCLKAAAVKFLAYRFTTGGLVTIIISGDVGAVKAAVDAGSAAARKIGEIVSSHVIPRPDEDTMNIISNMVVKRLNVEKKQPSRQDGAQGHRSEPETIDGITEGSKAGLSLEVVNDAVKDEEPCFELDRGEFLKEVTQKLREKLDAEKRKLLEGDLGIDEYTVKNLRKILRVLVHDKKISKSKISTMRKRDIIKKLVEIATGNGGIGDNGQVG